MGENRITVIVVFDDGLKVNYEATLARDTAVEELVDSIAQKSSDIATLPDYDYDVLIDGQLAHERSTIAMNVQVVKFRSRMPSPPHLALAASLGHRF